jgi:hypothetical protein
MVLFCTVSSPIPVGSNQTYELTCYSWI